MRKIIHTENAPKPLGAYSQAVRAGKFLFVSGQLGIDPETGRLTSDNIIEQTRRVMENIKAILKADDHSLNEIVQANVYLSSAKHFSDFNNEYESHFDKEPPARVTVGVELGLGALVEISVIAYCE
ncbi:MAG: deaminase [Candidatus Bathyarchaeota archaeon]|nr:MAG: deaminase [Candidatus Bathyarchaeota archaeon]